MDGLTHKQRRFVEEYLLCASATQAAIRAGYSARSAQVTSSRLMDDPAILKAIEEGQAARSERTAVDADFLLQRLFEEIEADLADIYDEDTGDLLPPHQWPPVWRRGLVAGVEIEAITADGVEVGKVKKVKLSDRVRRIEALGRHVSVQAFRDNVRIEGVSDLAERLRRAGSRADREDMVQRLVTETPPETHSVTIDARPLASNVREPEPEPHAEAVQAPVPAENADWLEPETVAGPQYRPILPPYPERQAYADVDYASMPDGFLSIYRD